MCDRTLSFVVNNQWAHATAKITIYTKHNCTCTRILSASTIPTHDTAMLTFCRRRAFAQHAGELIELFAAHYGGVALVVQLDAAVRHSVHFLH